MVNSNNLAGHQERYALMKSAFSPQDALEKYVGGGDVNRIGFREREIISRHHALAGASVVDIGCGIGRLARYLVNEKLKSYLGTEIIPEILEEARKVAGHGSGFKFEKVSSCHIPSAAASADIVCAFSVMTHLLDEEIYDYFVEAARVLRPGGNFVFSFYDFGYEPHRKMFGDFARNHKERKDVLKFIERSTLQFFAQVAGFSAIEFVDGSNEINAKRSEKLLSGEQSQKSFTFGQSLVWFRRN